MKLLLFMSAINILTACLGIRYGLKLRRIRKQWHKTNARLVEAEEWIRKLREVKEEWRELANKAVCDYNAMKEKVAMLSKTATDLSVTVDSLMNGDTVCENWHKYYSDGAGGQCPHCGVVKNEQPTEVKLFDYQKQIVEKAKTSNGIYGWTEMSGATQHVKPIIE